MFRNRTNSQKPPDELYTSFRQTFPEICSTNSPETDGRSSSIGAGDAGGRGSGSGAGAVHDLDHSAIDADDATRKLRGGNVIPEHEEVKDHDPTPRGNQDPWRFTPSLLDPNSFAFASLANQPPGYYTPTPGGTNTWYHSRAGDLHTPGMGIGVATPLSLPTTEAAVNVGSVVGGVQAFTPGSLAAHQFPTFRAFEAPASFAPSHFETQPGAPSTSFEPMDASDRVSPPGGVAIDTEMQGQSPPVAFPAFGAAMPAPPPPLAAHSSERFRFHVTLNAPTAMVRSADEIPITYLNKGQAYSMSIVDTAPPASHLGPTRYRTVVRISFEDEQQRRRPAACWQLWKEGRGTNEAHQRGGRLQAVEYVEPNSTEDDMAAGGGGGVGGVGAGAPTSTGKPPQVELEHSSFDGFSVHWTGSPAGADCCVAVRFNFLSTDFSHSKGVKGIPVRLCAKTEIVPSLPSPPSLESAEVCYCKVKLFRDHGAERKLSNDVAHVKKTIDKLKQQIAQAETGMRDFGKRKRAGSMAAAAAATAVAVAAGGRPGKVPKHKRTWSISSAGSSGGRGSIEEDLHLKLATMQDMFTSTRPVSVLHLRGHELDDPDAHPVQLLGDFPELTRVMSNELGQQQQQQQQPWDRRASGGTTSHTTATSSRLVSPASSASGHGFRTSGGVHSPRQNQADWGLLFQAIAPAAAGVSSTNPQQLASPPDQPVKILKAGGGGAGAAAADDQGGLSQWIEALEVDSSYQPPPERAIKPVACFYIRPADPSTTTTTNKRIPDRYYRAVYLMQRTAKDLIDGIATKLEIDLGRIERTVLNPTGTSLTVLVDDDVVREMREGQDMLVELVPCSSSSSSSLSALKVEPEPELATARSESLMRSESLLRSESLMRSESSPSMVGLSGKRQWDSGATDAQVDGDIMPSVAVAGAVGVGVGVTSTSSIAAAAAATGAGAGTADAGKEGEEEGRFELRLIF